VCVSNLYTFPLVFVDKFKFTLVLALVFVNYDI